MAKKLRIRLMFRKNSHATQASRLVLKEKWALLERPKKSIFNFMSDGHTSIPCVGRGIILDVSFNDQHGLLIKYFFTLKKCK